MAAKKFIVTGLVQGVFFRKYTQAKAEDLGLIGGVRNLLNGQVEAFAQGEDQALQAFEDWLWEGSPQCNVERVEVFETESRDWTGFQILALLNS